MFVLDTKLVSELRRVRSGKADPGVAAWAMATPPAQLFVSAITIHELEHGVLLAERADPSQGAVLRRWLDDNVTRAFQAACAAGGRGGRQAGGRVARS